MKIAIIGCGAISPLHVEGIEEAGMNIAALCDVNLNAAKNLKQNSDLTCNVYQDYKVMYAQEKPQAVHICTPHHKHLEMTEFFLKNDVHVLCEKPLALNLEQLNYLRPIVENSSAQLGVCLQNRYLESTQTAKKLIEGAKTKSVFALIPWHRDEAYYNSAPWRGKRSMEGGGLLINQAIHTLDLLMFFYGDVKSVQGNVANRSLYGVIDVEDTAEGLIRFENANAVFFASNALGTNYPIEIRILTDKNSIVLQAEKLFVDSQEIVTGRHSTTPCKHYWGRGHCLLIADFYKKISSGEKFPVGFEVGYNSLKLITDIYAMSELYR